MCQLECMRVQPVLHSDRPDRCGWLCAALRDRYPKLQGKYIFGDYGTGRMWALSEANSESGAGADDGATPEWTARELRWGDASECTGALTGAISRRILSFGEDRAGEIYVLTSQSASSAQLDGHVHRIVEPSLRADPSTCAAVAPASCAGEGTCRARRGQRWAPGAS